MNGPALAPLPTPMQPGLVCSVQEVEGGEGPTKEVATTMWRGVGEECQAQVPGLGNCMDSGIL